MIEALSAYSQLVDKSGKIIFKYLTTSEEYMDVIALRYYCNKLVGKLSSQAVPSHFQDIFDTKSKILLVKFNNRIIGSGRLIYFEANDATEYYKFIQHWSDVPSLTDINESSRICIHNDFQGMKLAFHIEILLILTSFYSGKRFILGAASGWVLDFHNRCGFAPLNYVYPDPVFNNIEHQLVMIENKLALQGAGVDKKVYNQIFLPAIKLFEEVLLF